MPGVPGSWRDWGAPLTGPVREREAGGQGVQEPVRRFRPNLHPPETSINPPVGPQGRRTRKDGQLGDDGTELAPAGDDDAETI